MTCEECHHAPSERNTDTGDYVATCYCRCHDVADHAPELLEAAETVMAYLAPDSLNDQQFDAMIRLGRSGAEEKLQAVISKVRAYV